MEEIAEALKIPVSEVVVALEAIVEPVSLYEPVYSDGGDTIYVMDQVGSTDSDSDWLDEITIKETIRNLSPREKKILALRFMDAKPKPKSRPKSAFPKRRCRGSKKARFAKSKVAKPKQETNLRSYNEPEVFL